MNINNAAALALEQIHLDQVLHEFTYPIDNSASWITTLHGPHSLNGVRFHTQIEPNGQYSVGVLCPYPDESRHRAVQFCIQLRNILNRY